MTAPTPTPDPAAVLALAKDIRCEADIADRPGQMGRLRDIAAKVDRLAGYVAAAEAVLTLADQCVESYRAYNEEYGTYDDPAVDVSVLRAAIATAIGGAR